ncbi:hypothetical protein EC957_000391 [Mortierella hygrophila]|uniref:Uncharacterized protein n=1 Tax=Mortierella hygrophila TaxID=979708 RepID=A0A9P6K3B6_9FUNG|nr:hypothetical protein EC957_000391 [Mortierella hygrophila]
MLLKRSTLVLLVLALVATSVTAQTLGDVIPMAAEPDAQPAAASPAAGDPAATTPGGDTSVPATTPAATSTTDSPSSTTSSATTDPILPTIPAITTDNPVVPSAGPTSTSHAVLPTQTKGQTTSKGAGTGTGGIVTTGSTTASITASPSPTAASDKPSTGTNLATAGIVVGSVVVAAAIGIWVFRKWKLSPSRDFQRKIGGDDYQDYPRTYESDTVFLRNLGDQPAEPAPTKSPYNANASLPSDDQYYDAAYVNDTTAQGGYGHDAYGPQQAAYDHQGYDHSQGYDHGYDNTAYGAGQHDYGGSQVGGGYGGSQVGGGYGGSQVGGGYGAQDAGYAASNVGGGYQHQGYDEYGHARR